MSQRDLDSWMWERANDLLDQVERFHRQLFRPSNSRLGPTWQPPIDIFETNEAVWLIVALPGVDPDGVQILAEHGKLLIRGIRSLPGVCQRAIVHRLEIPQGSFERQIDLPAGKYEPSDRQFLNGCLVFCLKKVL
jgi:HSP20 family protein